MILKPAPRHSIYCQARQTSIENLRDRGVDPDDQAALDDECDLTLEILNQVCDCSD